MICQAWSKVTLEYKGCDSLICFLSRQNNFEYFPFFPCWAPGKRVPKAHFQKKFSEMLDGNKRPRQVASNVWSFFETNYNSWIESNRSFYNQALVLDTQNAILVEQNRFLGIAYSDLKNKLENERKKCAQQALRISKFANRHIVITHKTYSTREKVVDHYDNLSDKPEKRWLSSSSGNNACVLNLLGEAGHYHRESTVVVTKDRTVVREKKIASGKVLTKTLEQNQLVSRKTKSVPMKRSSFGGRLDALGPKVLHSNFIDRPKNVVVHDQKTPLLDRLNVVPCGCYKLKFRSLVDRLSLTSFWKDQGMGRRVCPDCNELLQI